MSKKVEIPTLVLKHADLKGFKSIENVKIDFSNGLNVLIGKNASGKSNFLEFLYQVLRSNYRSSEKQFKYAKLEFVADNHSIVWELEKETPSQTLIFEESVEDRSFLNQKIHLDGKKIFDSSRPQEKVAFSYMGRSFSVAKTNSRSIFRVLGLHPPTYIQFNLPAQLDGISTSGSIKIDISEEPDMWETPRSLGFLNRIFWDAEMALMNDDGTYSAHRITKKNVLKSLVIEDSINGLLKKYTPIQGIKFNENVNIYKEDKFIIIENIKVDFKVNSSWVPWSQLSDGTRRLFYLITEIVSRNNGLILVEEPELGIHPHQFNLVMEFLKEQSYSKQTIISTHSPQALNHISEEDLQNILITYYDSKKGTQIKHMTKPQMNKAKKYMKEVGFLSDYWMMSDLE